MLLCINSKITVIVFIAYQTKLKASGVKTDYILLQGTLHGCINKPGTKCVNIGGVR